MKEKLEQYNQEHLLIFMDMLSGDKKEKFMQQLESINFEFLDKLFEEDTSLDSYENITPVNPIIKSDIKNIKHFENIGEKLVSDGKFALITMAGGQGSRLGFNGPKGKFVLKDKSLFEIFADKIRDYNISWFIMTSEENHDETEAFFKENNNFGLKEVILFKQNMIPLVDEEGKILIGKDGLIKFGADGSGGLYNALDNNNLIKLLEEKDIKYVFINGVDNCLTNPVDFSLLGLVDEKGYSLASKSVVKDYPEEKVGVLCYKDNKPFVIEYINLDENLRYLKDKNDKFMYYDAHVLANLMSVDLLKKISDKPLKYYKAHKKCDYLNLDGQVIIPDSPNAYKYECFAFDAFTYADDILILRVNREDEFAPLKNSDETGVDCPKTALELFENYNKRKKDFTKNKF